MKRHYQWAFWVGLIAAVALGGWIVARLYQTTLHSAEPRIQAVLAAALDEQFGPVEPVSSFAPDDVFYLSVRSQYVRSHSIVTVRWYYGDRLIQSQDQTIGAVGEIYVLGFELARTDGSWPAGRYRAEVFLDGALVGTAPFTVRA